MGQYIRTVAKFFLGGWYSVPYCLRRAKIMRRVAKANFQKLLRFELLESRIVFSVDMFELTGLNPSQPTNNYQDDGTLRFDQHGLAYYYDAVDEAIQNDWGIPSSAPQPQPKDLPFSNGLETPSNGPDVPPGGPDIPPSEGDVPIYHSNPSYTKKIYLDFDGQLVSGTTWNNQNYTGSYNTGSTINAPAFSTDADIANFSASELATIQEVWARVSEDYAPFQVDVTTEFPGAAAFTAGGQAIRAIISTDIDATTGKQWFPTAGGVAYLNSWNWQNGSPVWVFYNHLGNGTPKYVGEAASHEVGHSFNLSHDGTASPVQEYYAGQGSGPTGWAPIMGNGYYQALTQFSKGEYASANNQQDDLQIINNALAYAVDDHGDTISTSTQLAVGSAGAIASSGLIATRTDKDAFRFATQAGSVTINVDPFDFATGKGNLDVELSLVNWAGTTLATVNGADIVNASLTTTLAKGYYTLFVDGTGKSGTVGYSDYASIGKYSLSGTVMPNNAPIGVSDVASVQMGGSVLIDVLANDTDVDLDTLSLQSIGTPTVGTAVIESGKVRFTPPTAFSGQATFSYVVVDQFGATATGLVTINVALGVFVNAVTINGGAAQRSKLKTLTIEFNQQVVGFATAGAVVVEKRSDAVGGGPAANVPGVVVTPSTLGSGSTLRTLLTLTFTPLTTFVDSTGSLVDGNYQLKLNANLVTSLASGFKLDGDKNGIAGDDFVFGNKANDNFFRMFGDYDGGNSTTGQSFVDSFDAGAFLGSYLNPLGYNPIFDVNEDGFVDSFDAGAFLGNYLKQRNLNGFVL